MICEQCTQGDHCGKSDCYCQHRPREYGQLNVKRMSVIVPMSDEELEDRRAINAVVEAALAKAANGEPWQGGLVECAWCRKRVHLTRVGRVMHWHKDNRNTKYGKWGIKCYGSGKVNPK